MGVTIRNMRAAFPLVCALALWLAGCGALSPANKAEPGTAGSRAEPAQAPARPTGANRFEDPGELDKLLDARPVAMAAVKLPAASAATSTTAKPAAASQPAGKAKFRIQVGAESDFDAAQLKKREYEKMLGGTVDVTFDQPYYKLRWGAFETKQEAEDKILELSDLNIQGFVVKQ